MPWSRGSPRSRYSAPLVRWGTQLHERFLLPHFAMADLAEVVADLRAHDLDLDPAWFAPYLEFRFPRIGLTDVAGVELELRSAIEPWHVLGEDTTSGATVPLRRLLDRTAAGQGLRVRTGPAPARLQRRRGAADHDRYARRASSRASATRPGSRGPSLHPTLEIDSPLHFDVIDRASRLSLGGATYHVVHPGGRSYDHPPVNAAEAEARRGVRFEAIGHTTGEIDVEALDAELAWRASDRHRLSADARPAAAAAPALGSPVTVLGRYLAHRASTWRAASRPSTSSPRPTARCVRAGRR